MRHIIVLLTLMIIGMVFIAPSTEAGIIDSLYDLAVNIFTDQVAVNKYDVRIRSDEKIVFEGCSGYIPFDIEDLGKEEKSLDLGMSFEKDLCEVKWYEGYKLVEDIDRICDYIPTGVTLKDANGTNYPETTLECVEEDNSYYAWGVINVDSSDKHRSKSTNLYTDQTQSYKAYVECKCGSSGKFNIHSFGVAGETILDPIWESSVDFPIEDFTNMEENADSLNLTSGQTVGSAISVGFGTGLKRNNWIDTFFEYIAPAGTAESANSTFEFYEGPADSDQAVQPNTECRGNQFTPGTVGPDVTFFMNQLELRLFKTGTPGDLNVTIATSGPGGKPIDVLGNVQVPHGSVGTSAQWFNVTFPPIELSNTPPNVNYSWYTNSPNPNDGSNHWDLRRDESSPSYAGGEMLVSSDFCSTWAFSAGADLLFRVHGFTATATTSDANMTVCYSDDNSSFSSCDISVPSGGSLTNETAFYVKWMVNETRTATDIEPGIFNISINFSIINDLPTVPTNLDPANFTIFTVGDSIDFNWTNSTDVNEDTITYTFELYNESALTNIHTAVTEIAETASPTSTTISNFLDGDYFWRVNANDGTENSTFTNVTTVLVDTLAPFVEIASPTNISFDSANISLNVICQDIVSNCTNHQYSLNFATNVSFSPNTTILAVEGSNGIFYCAEDNFAHLNCTNEVNFVVDTIFPGFDFINPKNQTENLRTLDINITATEILDTSLYSINGAANVTFTGNVSALFADGDQNLFVCVNDTANNLFCNNTLFFVNGTALLNPVIAIENLIYETDTGFYEANITFNPLLLNTVNTTFNYNNTNFTTTKTNISDGFVNFISTIPIPPIGANTTKSFNPLIDLFFVNGSTTINITTNQTQEVAVINFSICAGDNNARFINITFEDESTGLQHNGSIVSSTFQHSLSSDLAEFKTLTYSTTVDQISHEFCFEPQQFKLFSDITLSYTAVGFEQRTFNNVTSSFTNETNNVTLFILSTADGIFVTFQVVNAANQPIEGVEAKVERGGNLIEVRNTDAAGLATFFLDPDLTYTFTFTKSGFDVRVISLAPTQASFTVTLGAVAVIEDNVNIGITYEIKPIAAILNNNTLTPFNFSINSSFFNLQQAGFNLVNEIGTTLGSATCTGITGCTASASITTPENGTIFMNFFWEVNSTFSNGTRSWGIRSTFTGQGSIKNFFEDVNRLGAGFDDFTKGLISLLIIVLAAGLATVGAAVIAGPITAQATLFIILMTTGFLDVVGFLPSIAGASPHFITIIVGIITFGYFLFEFTR